MEALNNGTEAYDKEDYETAVEYYRAAAMCGVNFFALNKLGVCYNDGKGVKKDLVKAKKLYKSAADKGNKDAKEKLKRLF